MAEHCSGWRRRPDGGVDKCRKPFDHEAPCDFNDPVAVAVSPEVARLIEAVGADNLRALLRVALISFASSPVDSMFAARKLVPDSAVWKRLGEALDGPVAWEGGANGMDGDA